MVSIPAIAHKIDLNLPAGSTTVFIGANGSGKTRLGVFIEKALSKTPVHRISAHRSLVMNTNITPPNFDIAMNRLRFGHEQENENQKDHLRWQRKPATALLNDFDFLVGALYAEENSVSVKFRQDFLSDPKTTASETKLDLLRQIWQELLPHRLLVVESANIKTAPAGLPEVAYSASEMSDGERVIFYMLGQALLAKPNTVLIIDEPELHINKSILAKLWDKIETRRKDCAVIYMTHDVEFATSRHGAEKLVVRSYSRDPEEWDIEPVPEDTNIPEDVVAMILGSRQPVLFVEGDGGSLDTAIYRRVYEDFTVIPVGSCEQVIHTVETFARQNALHRVGCAGIIDADGRSEDERCILASKNIYVLPVSEVENVLLLPNVFRQLAETLHFSEEEADSRLQQLKAFVLSAAEKEISRISIDFARRRIDASAKRIGLKSKTIAELDAEFKAAAAEIDPTALYGEMHSLLSEALRVGDYETVLSHFDNKGLLTEAAKLLGMQKKPFEEFLGRALRSNDKLELLQALELQLPTPIARPAKTVPKDN